MFAAGSANADQPIVPYEGETVFRLVHGGKSVAEISGYMGAVRSFLLLNEQFNQKEKEPGPGPIKPPAAKRAAGPMDMVSTWDPAFYPFAMQFEDLKGPQVTRVLKLDPAHPTIEGDLWTVFSRDPVFVPAARDERTLTLVWPDPATDRSDIYIERTWRMIDDYRMEGTIRLVNLGAEELSGRLRLLMPGWENPYSTSGGTCGGMFSTPPDIKQAVCMMAGSLKKKSRLDLVKEPGFEVIGAAEFAGINTRYFLMAAIPDPAIPTQCVAAADPSGVINTMIQWGDEDGRPFSLRTGANACLPDYVVPVGDLAGRIHCSAAYNILGLDGPTDMRTLTTMDVSAKGDAGEQAKKALLGLRAREFRFTAFVGPKDFDALKNAGPGLDDTIDFWVLGILAKPMLWLMRISYSVVPSWGLAIIFLTLVVKILTLYWTQKSMLQMKRMAALKPKMDDLKEKYKDDKAKMNQALMDLYKREKVNPLGGCLPMLLQMPIWIALYRTIYGAVDLYQAPLFLWIQDLSAHDPYFIMPVVMGALMFAQQKMMPTAGDPAQAKMMLWMMPIMFTSFMLFLPSGLVFYILVNTLLSIAHQVFVNRETMFKPAKAG
jgi:YidC/Oxa1 family membrane protein insertase